MGVYGHPWRDSSAGGFELTWLSSSLSSPVHSQPLLLYAQYTRKSYSDCCSPLLWNKLKLISLHVGQAWLAGLVGSFDSMNTVLTEALATAGGLVGLFEN